MKTLKITIIIILSWTMIFNSGVFAQKKKNPVRVLLITGGHGFDRELFDAFKNSLPGVTIDERMHPNALFMLRPENRDLYDVVLFYDMPEAIGEQEKKDFTDYLKTGKGTVFLHHAFSAYQDWPEYQTIMGGRYHRKPWTDDKGIAQPASSYKHDVHFKVKVADRKHPIVKGIKDFEILDETYFRTSVNPGVHVLLTTDEPTASPSVAWTNHYGKSKITTILLGHDNHAWTNPSFMKLVTQAIMWVK